MPHRRCSRLGALALGALAVAPSGCSGGGAPPGIVAVVVAFPPGTAPAGLEGAAVSVVDATNGTPIEDAAVTVNGMSLPYDAANADYEAPLAFPPAGAITLGVRVGAHAFGVTAPLPTEFPVIDAPASGSVWPAGCEGIVAWSGVAPVPGESTVFGAIDAADSNAPAALPLQAAASGATSSTIFAGALTPGRRLFIVGETKTVPIPGAAARSALVVLAAAAAPVTVVDAAYRSLTIDPSSRGISTGQAQQFRATAQRCDAAGTRLELTAAATWTSSDPSVATVSDAGIATGAGPGTTRISASVNGISGTTSLGVRDFVAARSPAPGSSLFGVTSCGGAAVAVGEGGTILTSSDGATWTQQASGSNAQLLAAACSPSRIVAVEFGSLATLTSSDAVTWTAGAPGGGDTLWSITWTGSRFVAVGAGGAILTSPDGLAWTARDSGTSSILTGVASSGTQLVAVGGTVGAPAADAVTSPDGLSWTSRVVPEAPFLLRSIAWTGSQFVAVGDAQALTSPDGVVWTVQEGASQLVAVAASGTEILAVGPFGRIATSTDGRTWIGYDVGTNSLTGVTWTGSRWVIVGGEGTILTSP